MLKILSAGDKEAGIHSVCLNSLKRAGNSLLPCSQNSKTFENMVIVATSFKHLRSCAIGVTFDVSWFPFLEFLFP